MVLPQGNAVFSQQGIETGTRQAGKPAGPANIPLNHGGEFLEVISVHLIAVIPEPGDSPIGSYQIRRRPIGHSLAVLRPVFPDGCLHGPDPDVVGQMFGKNGGIEHGRRKHRLHGIKKFADVAGLVVGGENIKKIGGDALGTDMIPFAQLGHSCREQLLEVIAPFPQFGKMDGQGT